MKRAIGIVLLILASIGAIGLIKNWNKSEPRQFGRSAAYESGRKAGQASAPIIVLALALGGLCLLKTSAAIPPELAAEPRTPIYKTKPAKILLLSAAALFALLACLMILNVSMRFAKRRPTPQTFHTQTPTPPSNPDAPTQTGPYQLNSHVQARWAGTTLPGRITEIHPGGFNVMVQLDDLRFPHPILMSTNLLKPR